MQWVAQAPRHLLLPPGLLLRRRLPRRFLLLVAGRHRRLGPLLECVEQDLAVAQPLLHLHHLQAHPRPDLHWSVVTMSPLCDCMMM